MADFKFNLDSISLMKANFWRQLDLTLYKKDSEPDVNVKVTHSETQQGANRGIDVSLSVDVSVVDDNNNDQIKVSADILGTFTIVGDPPQEVVNYFGNINAPAIIYPFAREAIANLTVKSNIAPILLPAMNFVEAYERSRVAASEQTPSPEIASAKPVRPRAKRTTTKPKQSKSE